MREHPSVDTLRARIRREREGLSGMLWVWPAVFTVIALVSGTLLSFVDTGADSPLDPILFDGGAEEARRLLLTVATTVVGVLALVIGLTMVALQVAANRYSPRLLRNFLRDRALQFTLGLFVATFAYNAAGLYTVGARDGDSPEDYPRLAVTVGLTLLFVCIGALLYFVDRMVHSIQIDTVLVRIGVSTGDAIDAQPPGVGRAAGAVPLPERPPWAVPIPAASSGYVQRIDPKRLLAECRQHGSSLRLVPQIGDHIVAGAPIAWVWSASPEQPPPQLMHFAAALRDGAPIGIERRRTQDVALGLVQIVDVALLSLHNYDFHTVIQACDELAVLLAKLSDYQLGDEVLGDGVLLVPARRFDDYLDLACGAIRRRGAGEPVILSALLRMLRGLAPLAMVDTERAALKRQAELVGATAERSVAETADRESVLADVADVLAQLARDPQEQQVTSTR